MTNNFSPKKNSNLKPQLSPEEWAEQKKAEKESVYQMIDEAVAEVISDPSKFKAFLDTQSRMDRYSALFYPTTRLQKAKNAMAGS